MRKREAPQFESRSQEVDSEEEQDGLHQGVIGMIQMGVFVVGGLTLMKWLMSSDDKPADKGF